MEEEEQEFCRNSMRAAEKETSWNLFQRLGGDSQSKNLSEVFRNYEASEKGDAKVPRWVDVKPPQPSYDDGDVRMKGRTVNLTIKKNLARLGRKWYIIGKDKRPVKEMEAFIIRRVQRQHKAHMNSLKVPTTSETSRKKSASLEE
ncbi:hypothetical protein D8674_021913 [Pyrus ussuriensis x Pyrus communis]|uniref:Uncharacterized protein n=1 Tax=Pyrus ussuriensis x Pyrus communis TaxID=2448454 RepID=A0A5N5GIH0_9ROSA|nr:hypothetical protein D8674_021913 [Pyrus ussuriensis x Pyrus communis]